MKIICEKSISGRTWVVDNELSKDSNDNMSVVDRILSARGIGDTQKFLNPSMRDQMPDPTVLLGMNNAVKIIADAVRDHKKIAIFGDYDVDGITSTAILIKFFRKIGANVIWHLPDREQEGYGLNEIAIKKFSDDGASVLLTVDCGITAVQEIDIAKKLNMTVVVTDHHEQSGAIINADAVVNPKQVGDTSGLSYLAGVGVAFMFLIALNRELGHPVSDLMQYLDLVAMGTICDTMPLVELNRAFVATGLKVLEKRQNLGLKILMELSGVKKVDAYTVGFVLGPRLNAAGRIQDANLALDLILTDNIFMANDLAQKLNDMNAKRQEIQNKILFDASEKAASQKESGAFCLFVSGDGWHGGVMGIVAGRLKEKYGLPCCVGTKTDGIINGSGRSIENVDLGKIIHLALEKGLLSAGGGHAAAAGFEMPESNENDFAEFLNKMVSEQLCGG